VKVFNNDSDEHVEDKEPDEQQERDEVEQTPLVVVSSWLQQTLRRKTTTKPIMDVKLPTRAPQSK